MSVTYTIFNSVNQFININSACFKFFLLTAPINVLSKQMPLVQHNSIITEQLYHYGIGFQSNTNPNVEFTFDYDLISGNPLDAIVPSVVTPPSTITWNNNASVYIGSFIDRTYWYQADYIGTIDNNTLQTIQQWILSYSTLFPYYVTFTVSNSPISRDNVFNPVYNSSTSSDFCYSLFSQMSVNSVPIDYAITPFVNIQTISVTGTMVTTTDLTAITNFYSQIKSAFVGTSGSPPVLYDRVAELEAIFTQINNLPAGDYSTKQTLTEQAQAILTEIYDDIFIATIAGSRIYYYSYSSGTSDLVYYTLSSGSTGTGYVDYLQSDLQRTVFAVDTSNTQVNDAYSIAAKTVQPNCCVGVTTTQPMVNLFEEELFFGFVVLVLVFFLLFCFMWYRSKSV